MYAICLRWRHHTRLKRVLLPSWCRWLAYLPFTQDTRVRVPVREELCKLEEILSPIFRSSDLHAFQCELHQLNNSNISSQEHMTYVIENCWQAKILVSLFMDSFSYHTLMLLQMYPHYITHINNNPYNHIQYNRKNSTVSNIFIHSSQEETVQIYHICFCRYFTITLIDFTPKYNTHVIYYSRLHNSNWNMKC